jgi:hypothetical protein
MTNPRIRQPLLVDPKSDIGFTVTSWGEQAPDARPLPARLAGLSQPRPACSPRRGDPDDQVVIPNTRYLVCASAGHRE